MGAGGASLRPKEFYEEAEVDLKLNQKVSKVNMDTKEISFEDGSSKSLKFDKLVIASGSSPRTLDVKGGDAKNVFVLRTPEDGREIVQSATGGHAVILGTSFIGMEVASSLAAKAKSVTVIGNSSVPFKRSLGETFGKFFMDLHESKGVKFQMGTAIAEFVTDSDGKAKEVVLTNGVTLPADVVVLGIGVTPNSGFLDGSQIDLTDRGFVSVNEFMETSVDGVYAVGDVASFPLHIAGGRSAAIGHWQLAHAHGRNAALNIAGKKTAFKSVPFFWTQQFGKSVRYAGYAPDFDDIVIDGDPSEGAFAAYYTKGEEVLAVGTIGRDPLAAEFANLLQSGGKLSKSEATGDWKSKL